MPRRLLIAASLALCLLPLPAATPQGEPVDRPGSPSGASPEIRQSPGALPEIAPGSVAFDYRNRPDVARLVGFETVVLSPQAPAAAAVLRARGSQVLYWLQPFLCPWRERAPATGTLLGDAYVLAEARDAWLRDTTGAVAVLRDFDLPACRVYDLRDSSFVTALAALVTERLDSCDGLVLDYGCPSIGWEPSLAGVEAGVWKEWAAGHMRYMELLRRHRPNWRLLCQCHRWRGELSRHCEGLVLEKVGWSLTSFYEVVAQAERLPEKRSILTIAEPVGGENTVRRRVTAALALLFDYGFSYRLEDARGVHSVRDPEHFALQLGPWEGPPRELQPGVHLRRSAHGFTLLNLSTSPYTFEGSSVPAGDALTVQTRDATTGEPIPWRTSDSP